MPLISTLRLRVLIVAAEASFFKEFGAVFVAGPKPLPFTTPSCSPVAWK
jgi:hypothetical protein